MGYGCEGSITTVTFKTDWNTDIEVLVVIDDAVTPDSRMELVMEDGGAFYDLGLTINTIKRCKVLIQMKYSNYLTFKWDNFKNFKVKIFICLNNIYSDYSITLKNF